MYEAFCDISQQINFFYGLELIVPRQISCGMSCLCKDNHLLRCCIDIYCSRTLYTGELEELKLAGG
jgi:hypothetical protein